MPDHVFLIPLVAMIVCVTFGLFAPRPPYRLVSTAFLEQWTIVSAVLIIGGLMLWPLGSADAAAMIAPVGLCGVFIAVWLATPKGGWDDGGGGWGGGGHGDDEPPPDSGPEPVDWEQFDRARASWSSNRTPAGSGRR